MVLTRPLIIVNFWSASVYHMYFDSLIKVNQTALFYSEFTTVQDVTILAHPMEILSGPLFRATHTQPARG